MSDYSTSLVETLEKVTDFVLEGCKENMQLKADNARLRSALQSYIGKFGNCGPVYDAAVEAVEGCEKDRRIPRIK